MLLLSGRPGGTALGKARQRGNAGAVVRDAFGTGDFEQECEFMTGPRVTLPAPYSAPTSPLRIA